MAISLALPFLGILIFFADPGVIKQKAPAERDLFGQTPLHQVRDENGARQLIAEGADLRAKDDLGNTPLHEATRRGNLKLVQFFLQSGANPGIKNAFGETPVDIAAIHGHAAVVSFFLKQGSPLTIHLAAVIGDRELLLDQIRKGADVNERTLRGRKPLHFVSSKEVAQILLTHGAYLNSKDLFNDIPLHIAARNGKAEVAEFILDRGAWLHDTNFWYQTPLHYAAAANRIEVVKILLARGADPKRKSANGKSALDLALERHYRKLYQLLKSRSQK
jgi:ankyrin repeat protein